MSDATLATLTAACRLVAARESSQQSEANLRRIWAKPLQVGVLPAA